MRYPAPIAAGIPIPNPMPTCQNAPRSTMATTEPRSAPKRHAHANLAPALLHAICGHAIEANCSQHKANRAKQPGKAGDHVLLVEGSLNHSRIRLNVIDHQVRIDFSQSLLHLHENVRRAAPAPRSRCCRGSATKSRHSGDPADRNGRSGPRGCNTWRGRVSETPVHIMNVLNDTDDLIGPRILHRSRTEVLADGILISEKFLREGFVDHGHVPRIPVVIFSDGAARQHSGADRIEEPRRDAGPVGGYIVLRAGLWFALNPNVVAPLTAASSAHRSWR